MDVTVFDCLPCTSAIVNPNVKAAHAGVRLLDVPDSRHAYQKKGLDKVPVPVIEVYLSL